MQYNEEQGYYEDMGNAAAYEADMNAQAQYEFESAQQEQQEMYDEQEEYLTLKSLYSFKGLNKNAIQYLAVTAIENVMHNGNPLEVAEALSSMEFFIKEVKADKRFTDYVREEIIKNGREFKSNSGAKLEVAEVGGSYDFSNCNDPLLNDLELSLKAATDNLKARKDFLKTIPQSGMDIVTDEGEVVKVYPPSKSSTSSYKITLAK